MTKKVLTQDQFDMKLTNLITIFNLLYDHAPISRADLAKLSGMSPTSITRFINNMLSANLLYEAPSEEKKVGRTATMLHLNETALYSVGINIDSTHTHVSILNFRQNFVADRYERLHLNTPTLEQVLDIAHSLYTKALADANLNSSQICGIGISITGPMTASAILDFTPQLKWKGINVRKAVQERFQMENVIVENDCNSAIVGQCVLHPEYKAMDIGCICIGSGVGSAVAYQGSLLSQPNGVSFSEIGHTIVSPDGMLCDCGNHGCLQTYLAEGALIERAQEHDLSIRTMEDLHHAWLDNSPWAKDLLHMACVYGKIAINNLACVYNPELILICGTSIDDYYDMFEEMFCEPQPFFEPLKGKVQVIPFFKMYQSSIIGVSQQIQDFHLKHLLKNTL